MNTNSIEAGDVLYDTERDREFPVMRKTDYMVVLETAGSKNRGLVHFRLKSGRYELRKKKNA